MLKDEFLSEEDLDLRNLSEEELDSVWTAWLYQAQATNDLDEDLYSHGVFEREPPSSGIGCPQNTRNEETCHREHGAARPQPKTSGATTDYTDYTDKVRWRYSINDLAPETSRRWTFAGD